MDRKITIEEPLEISLATLDAKLAGMTGNRRAMARAVVSSNEKFPPLMVMASQDTAGLRERYPLKDLSHYLEEAVQELDADEIGLAHNMGDATLEQLHEVIEFAERLKGGALVEMYLRERQARGDNPATLELPPEGYTGFSGDISGDK